jgi:hypothetical protein
MLVRWASAVLSLAFLVPVAATRAQRRATTTIALPLSITVAEHDGALVVSDAWIQSQVETANTIFAPHGVSFRVVQRERMDARHARLENRRDRHALGALLRPEVINCFVVLSLRDVDDPNRMRFGVHWRPRGEAYAPGAHFVIVSASAASFVLAHELGHFFGNGHSDVPGNIMSYDRGNVAPFFDDAQAQRIRFMARRFLRTGELRPVE